MNNANFFDILLVEDSEDDIYLTKKAFEKSKLRVNLHITKNGEEALDFLYKRGEYQNEKKPDLVLLDLNLPRIDGREVLKTIKQDETLRSIPIIVLTTSDATEDIVKSYQDHANGYVKKPVNFERFQTIIDTIEDFWFTVVRLPKDGTQEE